MECKKECCKEKCECCCYYPPVHVRLPAPDFSGAAYDPSGTFSKVSLKDFAGKYLVLFFYPSDFSAVCPTEILEFSRLYDSFKECQCEILGCSSDSQIVHMEYTAKPREKGGLGPVKMPLLADVSHRTAKTYGAYISQGSEEGWCVRATYVIDGKGIVRHISENDLSVGRNVEEILRLVQAFQHADKYGEGCSPSWKKGEKGIGAPKKK